MSDGANEENVDDRFERVRRDHYLHWFVTISIALYAWQLHGLLTAIVLLIGLMIVISVTNTFLIMRGGSFRAIRINRWAWVWITLIAVILSGASHGTV